MRQAVLDEMHVGDIHGALGTIHSTDIGPRHGWRAKLFTFLAILGPGLIVMVGDNDAGALSTYAQASQNYGTKLLWTLVILIPVLFVNQEMVLRLGSVTGVGHARLILERFGKFRGEISVIDLFLLNTLTIVTEFVGVSLALTYLGLPRVAGVVGAAPQVTLAAAQGSFGDSSGSRSRCASGASSSSRSSSPGWARVNPAIADALAETLSSDPTAQASHFDIVWRQYTMVPPRGSST